MRTTICANEAEGILSKTAAASKITFFIRGVVLSSLSLHRAGHIRAYGMKPRVHDEVASRQGRLGPPPGLVAVRRCQRPRYNRIAMRAGQALRFGVGVLFQPI